MFIWVICFFIFIRTDKTSVLHRTNLMRLLNFTATMTFGCALVFDLYKWCSFLVATSTYIKKSRTAYEQNMKRLNSGLVVVQVVNLLVVIGLDLMLMLGEQPNLDGNVT